VGRGLLTLAKVIAGFFALLIPVYGWTFFSRNRRGSQPAQAEGHKRFNTLFDALAKDLHRHGFAGGVIATEDQWVGGNLRLHFPESFIITPSFARISETNQPIALAVWQGEGMPPPLAELLNKAGAQDLLAQKPRVIRLNYHYSQRAGATFSYLAQSL
jgi:hypothetical protein